ncbi:MAG: 2-oxo acid dehydrogenase subunit E2 [Steroidobacteraceae bacterium]
MRSTAEAARNRPLASKDIHVPDLGGFKDVAVIEVLVHPGDAVEVDTPLLTLETEKATMDVPSPDAGVVAKIHVEKGAHVSAGSLIATLQLAAAAGGAAQAGGAQAGTAAQSAPAPAPAPAPTPTPTPAATPASTHTTQPAQAAGATQTVPAAGAALPPIGEARFTGAHASPSVRRFARELGVDLVHVRGTGQKGRITSEDLKGFVKSAMSGAAMGAAAPGTAGPGTAAGWPRVVVPDFAQFGPIEVKPLSRVQRIAGPRLQASWVNAPHVTQFEDADITELEEERRALGERAEKAGVKLTLLAFVVRACVKALQRFPQFNTSLDQSGENLVYKKYIHIGFAADTPNGLLVPVIRDADQKDIYETARSLAQLAELARAGKLSGAQMQGGSFTISSLGGIGGTAFTPIINAPEVAILGVSRSSVRPVFHDGGFVPRRILPLSLSYDHRVIDGAAGARFAGFLAAALADVRALIEAVP